MVGKYFFNGLKFFMVNLIYFHDMLLIICYFVLFFILCLCLSLFLFSGCYFFKLGNMNLEIVWTMIPALILLLLVEPSLVLLYASELFFFKKGQMVKVMGHQWYWSYNSDFLKKILGVSMDYDSYLVKQELKKGDFRLLEVDLPLLVSSNLPIYFFVSSVDVMHSFALPNLGLKMDAFPGRLNVGVSSGLPVGCYWGQCSEICGANHAFMPIGVEVLF